MTLADRLAGRDATVCVVGMGRVGLPLAIAFANSGLRVAGVDPDAARREAIELGKMPFHEPGSDQALVDAAAGGRLSVHAEAADAIPQADAIVLCVGTPLGADLRPDYSQLRSALDSIRPHLRPGQLLVQRSTVSPGTLQKIVLPALGVEGLLAAACPERIAEGKAIEELRLLPEIVGGIDDASTDAAAALFSVLDPQKTIHRTDALSAELAKLYTNVYRYVNFALANEFAILGEYYGVDAHQIIDMVNTGYPRASIPSPGPAGGPCLSKDGYFLVEELTLPDFVLVAWKLNDSVPGHVVRRLSARLRERGLGLKGTPVAVLGRTFKKDSDDVRQSPSERVIEILKREGAEVRVHDPHLPGPSLREVLSGARGFVLATNHTAYESLDAADVASLLDAPRIGVDCWGVLDRSAFAAAGVEVGSFGVGDGR